MSEPAGERLSLWRDELEFSASWRHWRHRVPVDGLSLWRDELEFSASWRHWLPVDDPRSRVGISFRLDSDWVLLGEPSKIGTSGIPPLKQ